ncbi:MAG: hypothetical protein ACI4DK_07365 [Lachnospiraceae bacterium]
MTLKDISNIYTGFVRIYFIDKHSKVNFLFEGNFFYVPSHLFDKNVVHIHPFFSCADSLLDIEILN